MLSQHLINVLNSGNAWAFVGSGASADAGVPSWETLLEQTYAAAESKYGTLDRNEKKNYDLYVRKNRLTDAFSELKSRYGSKEIDRIVCEVINRYEKPGDVIKRVALWPFEAYVTTNYDHLLEKALSSYGGWVPIGNTASENKKISGDVKQVIWHPHGGAELGEKNSNLVLATSDYDEIYPGGSNTLTTLNAIFRLKRIIFIGFGFRDPDLIATLERVGRFISPERPAFAFLANATEANRKEFWEKYRVEVIPYKEHDGNHSDLLRVIDTYNSFVIDRSIQFGRVTSTPGYDIEAVGLLTQNKIVGSDWLPSDDAQSALIKGFVLTQLNNNDGLEKQVLLDELSGFSSLAKDVISGVVKQLIDKRAIKEEEGYLFLTVHGRDLAIEGKGAYELKRDQFVHSIKARATENCPENERSKNICEVTVNYLERTCRERGLGVAQQLAESGRSKTKARAVALLQDAKGELDFAADRDAAIATVQCIRDVFSDPRPEERQYLGYLTQAYFAKHILGIDPSTIRIKRENLATTVFIADSNFIIPLLAIGSVGHKYAYTLFERLNALGCKLVTSDWLLTECLEHAKWAWDLLDNNGSNSATVIDVLRGARGYRPNAFLTGYVKHENFGPDINFKKYFARVFGNYGDKPKEEELVKSLDNIGITIQPLSSWNGFEEDLWAEKEKVQEEIKVRRLKNGTYKRELQVKAEAEVAVIVTHVRSRHLTLEGRILNDAYFLSYSRVVDGLPGQSQKVCMAPESLFEWIVSISEISDNAANAVYDQLLWELSKEGVDVVPRRQLLTIFGNTIDVSKLKFAELVEEHRDIVRDLYTADIENAFVDVDPLMIPSIVESVSKEVLREMQERIEVEQNKRESAEKVAKMSVKDSQEFERLKAEKKKKQAKAKKQKRAAASRPKKKTKKR